MAKITKSRFVALEKKHVTDTAVAKALGISRQAVLQLRSKFGINQSRSDVGARNAAIVEAYVGGETGVSIAKRYKLSMSQTYRVLDASLGKAKKKSARAAAKVIRKAAKAKANASIKKTLPAKKRAAKKKKRK